MRLQHCYKCQKQIEFRNQKNRKAYDTKKSQMNRLQSQASSQSSADVFEYWYCNDCWFRMSTLLQSHGYLPNGIGFQEMEDD